MKAMTSKSLTTQLFVQQFFQADIKNIYCQVSNIRRTESKTLNVSRLSLQLSLHNLLKPGVKPRMKM